MNSQDNSTPFECMETDKKELYKKTPLKKRPIQQSSLPPDEKIAPRPRAMRKPTERIIDSYGESAEDLKPVLMEAVCPPVFKTPAEGKVLSPVQMNSKAAMAIPVLKATTCEEKKVPSRGRRNSKAFCKENLTKQEWEDFNMAIELQKEEFNLRERRPKRTTSEIQVEVKRKRQPVKTKRTRAVRRTTRLSSQRAKKNGKKQVKQRRTTRRTRRTRRVGRRASTPALPANSNQTCILSPPLAKVLGQKEVPFDSINIAFQYLFLERNLFEEDRKYVICDEELSEFFFEGKRRLRFVDAKKVLYKHFTLSG